MRYALVSDIHANLPAWKAVLLDSQSLGVDQVICLGDIVGYGPFPAEVLASVHRTVDQLVLGNHDAVVGGRLDPACFNAAAREAIDWTKAHLDRRAVRFLGSLPHVLQGPNFTCVHADLVAPEQFRYILQPDEALANFTACDTQLLFVGHSHAAGIFVLGNSGVAHAVSPVDFSLEEGKRYIVNPGSVGLPRDGDPRAGYCIFDSAEKAVYFRRIPFDPEPFAAALKAAGLPPAPCGFLDIVRNRERPPLRDDLDFRPPTDRPRRSGEVSVAQLHAARRAVRAWRIGFVALLALLLLALLWMLPRLGRTPVAGDGLVRITAAAAGQPAPVPGLEAECLSGSLGEGVVAAGRPLEKFSLTMADPARQQVAVEKLQAGRQSLEVLRLRSAAPLFFELRSLPVAAVPGMRFGAALMLKPLAVEAGYLELLLVQNLEDGTELPLERRLLTDGAAGRWTPRSVTMPREKNGAARPGTVSLVVRGEFSGEVLLRDFSLILRELHLR